MTIYRWVKLILVFVVVFIFASLLWRLGLLLPNQESFISLPTMQTLDEVEKGCIEIEVSESAKSKEDALLVAKAVMNEMEANGASACEIFNAYTILRPSGAGRNWAVRDVRVIRARAKLLGGVHAARVRRGEWAVKQLTTNPTARHAKLSVAAQEVFPCVVRIIRTPKNLLQRFFRPAGRKVGKIRKEMGKSWKNPSTGTEFFCYK